MAANNPAIEASFDRDMDRLLNRMETLAGRSRDGALHFAVGETGPEADLMALLGGGATEAPDAGEAQTEFDAFIARISEDLLHFAALRTGSAGSAVGTWVAWSGDTVTVVGNRASAALLTQHAEELRRQALPRSLRLKMLVTTAAAAGRIATLISVPGGPLLALPVIYRYIRSMSQQWQAQLSL